MREYVKSSPQKRLELNQILRETIQCELFGFQESCLSLAFH